MDKKNCDELDTQREKFQAESEDSVTWSHTPGHCRHDRDTVGTACLGHDHTLGHCRHSRDSANVSGTQSHAGTLPAWPGHCRHTETLPAGLRHCWQTETLPAWPRHCQHSRDSVSVSGTRSHAGTLPAWPGRSWVSRVAIRLARIPLHSQPARCC